MNSNENLICLTFIVRIVLCFLIGAIIFYAYRYWINGVQYRKDAEFPNKVAIVTGASHGIGRQVAYGLAKRGLYVIMACYDLKNGIKTQNEIIERTGNQNVRCIHLDLGSFKSIRLFADEFLNTGLPLDILIHNANVLHLKRQLTEEGIESNIAINYLGPFLLTMLLIKQMAKTTPTRIINVAHWIHRWIEIDQTDLMCERNYSGFSAYARSQLANVYFTLALSKRIENTGITCNCVHPGISLANLIERQYYNYFPKWIPKQWVIFLAKILLKTERACASTIIFAAIDFSLQNISGVYLSNTQIGEIGSNTTNSMAMEWLWKYSEEITGERLCDLPNNFKFLKENSKRFP